MDLAIRLDRGKSLVQRLWFAFRHFYTFGTLLLYRVAILGGDQADRYRIEFTGEEQIRSALAGGRGAVLLTGHIGNWEVMGQLLTRLDAPFNMVMFDGVPPALKATMENLARDRTLKVLYTDGSPTAAAAMLKVLRDGEMVGMQGDRGLAGEPVEVPFLGGTAALPVGAYVLAAAAKAPLLHVFAVRRGWRRYSFHGFETPPMSYRDRRNKQPDLQRWATAFASRMEDFLREYPHQWGNFFPFWK